MKKIESLLFCLVCLFAVSSCSTLRNSNNFSNSNVGGESTSTNNRIMRRFYVDATYNKDLNIVYFDTQDFNFSNNMKLISKQTTKKLLNYIVGDYLEVYFSETDNNVEEIIVDEANIISIKKLSIPGEKPNSGYIDLITEDSLLLFNHDEISYVINQDNTITYKCDIEDGTILYGVYREEDKVITNSNLGYYICNLVGIYSYFPRIS